MLDHRSDATVRVTRGAFAVLGVLVLMSIVSLASGSAQVSPTATGTATVRASPSTTVTAESTSTATFFGHGLTRGETVVAFIGGRRCASDVVDAAGDWRIEIGSTNPCGPADGAVVTFTVDGSAATSMPPAVWHPDGFPPGPDGYELTVLPPTVTATATSTSTPQPTPTPPPTSTSTPAPTATPLPPTPTSTAGPPPPTCPALAGDAEPLFVACGTYAGAHDRLTEAGRAFRVYLTIAVDNAGAQVSAFPVVAAAGTPIPGDPKKYPPAAAAIYREMTVSLDAPGLEVREAERLLTWQGDELTHTWLVAPGADERGPHPMMILVRVGSSSLVRVEMVADIEAPARSMFTRFKGVLRETQFVLVSSTAVVSAVAGAVIWLRRNGGLERLRRRFRGGGTPST